MSAGVNVYLLSVEQFYSSASSLALNQITLVRTLDSQLAPQTQY